MHYFIKSMSQETTVCKLLNNVVIVGICVFHVEFSCFCLHVLNINRVYYYCNLKFKSVNSKAILLKFSWLLWGGGNIYVLYFFVW